MSSAGSGDGSGDGRSRRRGEAHRRDPSQPCPGAADGQRSPDSADSQPLRALLAAVEAAAWRAADEVMAVYATAFAVAAKADASPVTDADRRAEAVVVAALRELDPGTPVVAEEAVAAGDPVAAGPRFWLVDALDGTREFVSRNGEFTVNVALVEHGVPVLGVVVWPVAGRAYLGAAGQGAWRRDGVAPDGVRRAIRCRIAPDDGVVAALSRSHGDAAATRAWLVAAYPGQRLGAPVVAGSSLKFGLLAEGAADVYPRLSRTMEWDTAAGHAVLLAAGGEVVGLDGAALRYGKQGFENPSFVARGAAR